MWVGTMRGVRLGSRTQNEFMESLNSKDGKIRDGFAARMADMVGTVPVKVMMGDSTVVTQQTFDPKRVSDYLGMVGRCLDGWSVQDVSSSNNDDLRRLFTRFEVMEGDYLISVHLSVQFHVLLYYRPDQRVIECQKELSGIVDSAKSMEERMSEHGDEFVLARLKEMGYRDLNHKNLFEIFYENDGLREGMYGTIQEREGADFEDISARNPHSLQSWTRY